MHSAEDTLDVRFSSEWSRARGKECRKREFVPCRALDASVCRRVQRRRCGSACAAPSPGLARRCVRGPWRGEGAAAEAGRGIGHDAGRKNTSSGCLELRALASLSARRYGGNGSHGAESEGHARTRAHAL
eukprot:5168649-Pleurochrysis_carterae.AAC.1